MMMRRMEGCAAELRYRSMQQIPPDIQLIPKNVALDIPCTHKKNYLHQYGNKTAPICLVGIQTHLQVLNDCPKAMDPHKYRRRHVEELKEIGAYDTTKQQIKHIYGCI